MPRSKMAKKVNLVSSHQILMKQKGGQELHHVSFKNGKESHVSLISLNIHGPKKIGPGPSPCLSQKWPRKSL